MTFVVIYVYVMNCHLLLTVLDSMSLLLIRDPTPIPFRNPRPPKEGRIPTMIDFTTQHGWNLLRQTLCKKFCDQYHHINAMKYSNMLYRTRVINVKAVGYLDCSSLYANNVKFSYVIDMHVMLFPGLQNDELIDNMMQTLEIEDFDVLNGRLMQELRKSFISLLMDYIWRSITRLTEMVTKGLIKEEQLSVACNSCPLASDNVPATKHPKTLTTISSILSHPRLDQPNAQSGPILESMDKTKFKFSRR